MRVLAVFAVLAFLGGCGAPQPTPRADRTAPMIWPEGYSEKPTHSKRVDCADPGISLNPAALPRSADGQPRGAALDRVRDPAHGLVIGVSQTAERSSHRDLLSGDLSGFEIEIAKRIAKELYGDPDDPRLHLATVPTGSRLYALDTEKNKQSRADPNLPDRREIQPVDLVIADVSVTCARIETYGLRYSAPYLATNSGLMVRKGTIASTPDDLGGRKVCSGLGTTNSDDMIEFSEQQQQSGKMPLVPVAAADTSDCLMLLQRGQIDAIYTDVLILEGFRRQDPGTVILDYRAPRNATAAIALGDKDEDLIRFVNGVLERMRADGSLQARYTYWFGEVQRLLPLPPVRYSD